MTTRLPRVGGLTRWTVGLAAVAVASWLGADRSGGAVAAGGTAARGSFAGQVAIGGGRGLYLRCAGTGSPTVILESGIHDSSDPWTLTETTAPVPSSPSVFEGVSRVTHVCMYDRPGTIRYTSPPAPTTRSSHARMPRTLRGLVSDLHRLLLSAGVRGPYVLVGHSFGGLIARLFAQTYQSQATGMVLLDAFGTDLKRLFGPRLWPRYRELLNHPGTPLDDHAGFEMINVDGAIRTVMRARPLPRMPLAVVSKTEPFATAPGTPKELTTRLEKVWPLAQRRLVKLEPHTPHVLATGSDHYVQIHDPDLTITMIRLIVNRARHRG